ncbi:hypothetical protein N7474_004215 [Penicillium riverlandense]|uniref:uncharacterized protein n=1 Tax=Penicillium riverlandense TaxID=1903569 RepID=UPI002548656E|nr:uncharacterized protein N7474_004215 [Penicillium riverlandense]KAJ5818624.1 hypothetical protein N7474_004215 [Penicillium riverlandense]
MSLNLDGQNGKAPDQTPDQGSTRTPRERPLVQVQPARLADLQPKYAAQIDHQDDNPDAHGWYASLIHNIGQCIGFCGAIPCCVCCPNPFKPVDQGQVGLVTKFGRFERAVDPGLVKVNPLSEHLTTVDVKIQIVEVPRQTCMTKDNVTLTLTSVIYYEVVSPHVAAFGIANARQALIERTQTTLRHVVGARVLQDVIERREEIAQSTSEIIEEVAAGWGVQVESMLIKDIIFSTDLQDSLSMAAQSKRIGESKVIAARAEVESAKLMRQAADILSSAPAMQIRYLEAMQAMAKSANSKVIFLPGISSNMSAQLAAADNAGEGPSKYDPEQQDDGFQRAMNARIVEDI